VQLQPLVDALAAELLRQPVLHADETPVAMLKPGHGKTHRASLWSDCTTSFNPIKAVVFDFADSRGGQHVRTFLDIPGEQGWRDKLVCGDFSGYKACFELGVDRGRLHGARAAQVPRQKIPDGSATARAIDYSLNRRQALTRFLDDGDVPIDNNWVENRVRADRARAAELAVRRQLARRQARRRRHEPDPLGQAQRARFLRLHA
jgi:hypothetical protein